MRYNQIQKIQENLFGTKTYTQTNTQHSYILTLSGSSVLTRSLRILSLPMHCACAFLALMLGELLFWMPLFIVEAWCIHTKLSTEQIFISHHFIHYDRCVHCWSLQTDKLVWKMSIATLLCQVYLLLLNSYHGWGQLTFQWRHVVISHVFNTQNLQNDLSRYQLCCKFYKRDECDGLIQTLFKITLWIVNWTIDIFICMLL